jgi:protein-S-isoprenylcysteine O-methyltransferase Ste14
MNEEYIFRIIFWAQLIFIMIVNRLLPALRAKKSGVKLSPDREAIQNEGKYLFAFRVISGLMVAAAIIIYTFFPTINTLLQVHLPSGLRWAGVILSSMCLMFWSYSQELMDKNWSANLKIQKGHTLVTTGPYRVMRHPIYTAMIFWSIGLAMYTAHILFMVLALLMIVWTPPRVLKEEKMLASHFGDVYLDYMKKTGRYFPKFIHH